MYIANGINTYLDGVKGQVSMPSEDTLNAKNFTPGAIITAESWFKAFAIWAGTVTEPTTPFQPNLFIKVLLSVLLER